MLIDNWRPISLSKINVDAKTISKVMATRIKNVLPHIIHCNQSGYTLRIDTLVRQSDQFLISWNLQFQTKNIPGLLIFIDFQKAFDTLEWNILFSCLNAF